MYVSPIMNFNNSAHNAQIKRAKSKGINIENRVDNNRVENYYVTAPSFKMGEYKAATKAAAAAFTAALATYGIKVAQNTEPEEEAKLPTYEEFKKMLNDDINISEDNKEYLCRKFKENPQNAWDLYDFKDENGYRYLWLKGSDFSDVYPEIAKILLNIQNDNRCKLFPLNMASYSPIAAKYPIGFAAMISVQDEYGQKRFEGNDYLYAAKYFGMNPEKAIEMATEKDELGNYKYELDEIIEDIQKRTDDDKILKTIADIKRPNGRRARLGEENKEKAAAVIDAYKKYPEEVTKLLQLSTNKDSTKNRFDLYDIDEKVVRFYKEAPITFMTLANSFYREYNIYLNGISTIMEALCYNKQDDTIHEIDSKTLSDVIRLDSVLANVRHSTERVIYNEGAETYMNILEAYKKYPAEFMYILTHYTNYGFPKAPTINDILLFQIKQKIESLNLGITGEQFFVLDTIYRHENIYQQQLSDIIMKDTSNTNRILEILENKGLITKEYGDANNRPVYFLNVTEKGRHIVEDNLPAIKK